MNHKSMTLAVAALALLASPTSALFAEYARLEIAVDGMACPFCAYGVEKRLKRLETVQSVAVDLEGGVVTVMPAGGADPNPQELTEAIEDSGFSPGDIDATAIGTLVIDDGVVYLVQRGSGSRVVLETEALDGDAVGGEVPDYLADFAAAGALLAGSGTLHGHQGDNPPGISVASLEEVRTVALAVDGLSCEDCGQRAAAALADLPGVYRVVVDEAGGSLLVEAIGAAPETEVLVAALAGAGFTAREAMAV